MPTYLVSRYRYVVAKSRRNAESAKRERTGRSWQPSKKAMSPSSSITYYSAWLPTGTLGSSLKTRKLFLFVFSSARLHIIRSPLTSSPPPHCRVISPQLHPPLECYFKDPVSFALFSTLASPAFPQSVYSEIRGLSQSDIVLLGS